MSEPRVKLHVYPDKPFNGDVSLLEIASQMPYNYVCEQKVDGFRMVVDFLPDRKLQFITRHGKDYTAEISPEIVEDLTLIRLKHNIPSGTRIDCEWRSRRSCSVELDLPQRLFVFDIMRWENNWVLHLRLRQRFQYLYSWFPIGLEPLARSSRFCSVVRAERAMNADFVAYFEHQKQIPWSEGVVLKHVDSGLVGGKSRSENNPLWSKVKYRGGIDGEVRLDKLVDENGE